MEKFCPLCGVNTFAEPSYDNYVTVRVEALKMTATTHTTAYLELESKCCYDCLERIQQSEKTEKIILVASIVVISAPLWITLLFSRPPSFVSLGLIIAGLVGFYLRIVKSKDRFFQLPENSSLKGYSETKLLEKSESGNQVVVRTKKQEI